MKKITFIALGATFFAFAVWIWGVDPTDRTSDQQTLPVPSASTSPAIDPIRPALNESTSGGGNSENRVSTGFNPITLYRPTSGLAGRNILDEMYVKGVPKGHDSVLATRELLKKGISDDEKVALTRILGSLYQPGNSVSDNEGILFDLKRLASDGNREVAGMAAITYARLGYFSDSESTLASAYEANALNADGYFGELAHLLDIAPPNARPQIAKKINDSSNAYAADILASSINGDPESLGNHSKNVASEIAQLLQKNEPEFSSGMGEFGLFTAIRYSTWLRASAKLEGQSSGREVDALVIENLSRPGTDPRKVMAYLLDSKADSILNNAPPGSAARGLIEISNKYAMQFIGNPMLQEYAESIKRRANQGR